MAADPIITLRKQVLAAIRGRLEQYEMNQTELAEELGLSRARLHLLRTGTAQAFSLEALVRIALSTGLVVRLSVTRPYAQD